MVFSKMTSKAHGVKVSHLVNDILATQSTIRRGEVKCRLMQILLQVNTVAGKGAVSSVQPSSVAQLCDSL